MSIITKGLGGPNLITQGYGGRVLIIEETIYVTLTPDHWLSKKILKCKAKLIEKVESGIRNEYGELIEGNRTFYVYTTVSDIQTMEREREAKLFGTYDQVTTVFYIPSNKEGIVPRADDIIEWKSKKFRVMKVQESSFESKAQSFDIFELFCKEIKEDIE